MIQIGKIAKKKSAPRVIEAGKKLEDILKDEDLEVLSISVIESEEFFEREFNTAKSEQGGFMKVVKAIVGFLYNLTQMLINIVPMSIAMGTICYRKNATPWEIEELELLHDLEKVASEE